MRPRLHSSRTEFGRGRPPAVVEARALPADGDGGPVDVLGVIDLVPFEVALGPGQPRPLEHPPGPVADDELRGAVAVEDRHLHDATRVPGGVALGRSLPAVEQGQRVRAPGSQERSDVQGLVVLGVGVGVCLALAGPGAVDVELVLLVSRDVGAGPNDGGSAERDLGAGVGVLVGLQVRLTPDPLGLPVGLPQTRVERGARRKRSGPTRRRPGLHGPAVGGVGCQRRPRVGDERLGGAVHPSAVPHRGGGAGAGADDRQTRHDQPVGALQGAATNISDLPCELDVCGIEADGRQEPVDAERHGASGGAGCFVREENGSLDSRPCLWGCRASCQAGRRHPPRQDDAAREYLPAAKGAAVVFVHGVRSAGTETPP